MSDGVNTAMNGVEAAGAYSPRNTRWGEADGSDLRGRHDAMLVRGDPGDGGVRRPLVAFLSHSGKKGDKRRHLAPFIASFGAPANSGPAGAAGRGGHEPRCVRFPRPWRPNAH
jgi:hypothetical protein